VKTKRRSVEKFFSKPGEMAHLKPNMTENQQALAQN
jgi:hypothetical protein